MKKAFLMGYENIRTNLENIINAEDFEDFKSIF
jgi:hypothetical protein